MVTLPLTTLSHALWRIRETFQKAFTSRITAIFYPAYQHICIDGKAMRGVKKFDPARSRMSSPHTLTA